LQGKNPPASCRFLGRTGLSPGITAKSLLTVPHTYVIFIKIAFSHQRSAVSQKMGKIIIIFSLIAES